jgi:hypothetical protein
MVVVPILSGCGGSSQSDQAAVKIRDQAAFDLQCDKSRVMVQKLSDDAAFGGVENFTFGVRGCDKQATYKASCAGWTGCSIMTDAQASAMQQGQAPGSAPPSASPAAAPAGSAQSQPTSAP